MIRSMTAYARQESQTDLGTLVWELRSVNHRYLDLFFRLPEEFRALEGVLRTQGREHVSRGKIECLLSYTPAATLHTDLTINEALAKAVIAASHEIEISMNNPARISALEVLKWPGVAREPSRDLDPLLDAALSAFSAAVQQLTQARETEGARLKEFVLQRLQTVQEITARLRERHPQVIAAMRDKLLSRLSGLEITPDSNRLEQELVFFAQKLDIDEELDRLDSHCREMNDVLGRSEAVGRRLDFLLQEFNREANTVASKSGDVDTTQAAVDLKVVIEQMREQVQNIE